LLPPVFYFVITACFVIVGLVDPATIYIVFSRGVPVRSKVAYRRCSHSTARWGNAACGPARHGLSLNIIGLDASGEKLYSWLVFVFSPWSFFHSLFVETSVCSEFL